MTMPVAVALSAHISRSHPRRGSPAEPGRQSSEPPPNRRHQHREHHLPRADRPCAVLREVATTPRRLARARRARQSIPGPAANEPGRGWFCRSTPRELSVRSEVVPWPACPQPGPGPAPARTILHSLRSAEWLCHRHTLACAAVRPGAGGLPVLRTARNDPDRSGLRRNYPVSAIPRVEVL